MWVEGGLLGFFLFFFGLVEFVVLVTVFVGEEEGLEGLLEDSGVWGGGGGFGGESWGGSRTCFAGGGCCESGWVGGGVGGGLFGVLYECVGSGGGVRSGEAGGGVSWVGKGM